MSLFCRLTLVLLLIGLATPADAGESGDALVFTDMDGAEHAVDEVLASGRNVVFVFWQTWCGPCKREAPHLAAAARAHADGLEFFGVIAGTDEDVDDAKVRKYVEKYDLPYAQIRDRDLALTKLYEVVGTPTILVLGPARELLYRGNHPPEDWSKLEPASE